MDCIPFSPLSLRYLKTTVSVEHVPLPSKYLNTVRVTRQPVKILTRQHLGISQERGLPDSGNEGEDHPALPKIQIIQISEYLPYLGKGLLQSQAGRGQDSSLDAKVDTTFPSFQKVISS